MKLEKLAILERNEAIKILQIWNQNGLPDEFSCEGIDFLFDANFGDLSLKNSIGQKLMATDNGELLFWGECPGCGERDFIDDMEHNEESEECQEFLEEIKS